jgi:hypothetical protein
MKAVVVLFCVWASGCATTKEVHPLTKRASFDFQCPTDQLLYYELDRRSYGVSGCDKRATYVETCQGQGFSEQCTWVLNGAVESTQPARATSDE